MKKNIIKNAEHNQPNQIMAKENDEVQQHSNNNTNSNNSDAIEGVGSAASASAASASETHSQEYKDKSSALTVGGSGDGEGNGEGESEPTCARGKLNDLVADLCMNGAAVARASTAAPGGFGDYTNIRATVGPTASSYNEALHAPTDTISSTLSATQAQPLHVQQQPPPPSSFSFKHFLNSSSSALTAPSTTVTSLDPVGASSSSASAAANPSSPSLQTSTGARPKVPQTASISASSISTLMGGLSVAGALDAAATKMKRSPRFSSFDSQASLAEYAGAGDEITAGLDKAGGVSSASTFCSGGGSSTGFRLYPDALGGESSDLFGSRNSSHVSARAVNTGDGDYERKYVPRSYSNYDMPMPPASPRRRIGVGCGGSISNSNTAKESNSRPTRLALNTNSSKLKLDLPIENAATAAASSGASSGMPSRLQLNTAAGDFAPAAAAALPDFVQDHWMDSWYAHEMHLNSPPNSPVCDFVEDLTGAAAANVGAAATCGGPSSVIGRAESSVELSVGGSKMLPDFLSDGPIIHSSQRLADVAAGLPSNSMGSPMGSPEIDAPQFSSRLRSENERLLRELSETRAALSEQTRRSNDLERQLQEQRQRNDSDYNRSMSQNITLVEENLDKSKRRTAAAQSHVTKLKQQVTQLTAEVETLRRENETLREEGAVGGVSASAQSYDRSSYNSSTAAAASATGGGVSASAQSCDRSSYNTPAAAAASASRGNAAAGRPSRTQQFSRDLLRAASNAESNLRQLLVGVDNLRQMAADIENTDVRLDYDVSPDLFSDFLEDCDDYEYPGGEYPPGGPAL